MKKKTFLAMIPLFFQTETIESIYSAATAPVHLVSNRRLCCRQRWKVSAHPWEERDETEANRSNQMNNVCPPLPSQYLLLQSREERVVDNELKKSMGKPLSAFPAHCTLIYTGLWFVLNCLTLREQHEPLCFQNQVEQPSWYFCCERMRYW